MMKTHTQDSQKHMKNGHTDGMKNTENGSTKTSHQNGLNTNSDYAWTGERYQYIPKKFLQEE